jgi:Peptidase A4 family
MELGWRLGPSLLGVLVVLTIPALSVDGPSPAQVPAVTSGHRHDPIIIRERHGKNVTSTNWSGYAVTGANDSVTHVKGSWIVPKVDCGTTPSAYSSFWIGIDGYSSNTVEQIGTDSDCVNGAATNYVWYEFYPHPSYTVNKFPISPGDPISADITYSPKGGQFTVTLTDERTGQSFSISTKMPNAKASSAEWIVEAPWSGGVLPLADFGTAYFGDDYTGVDLTCFATVGGAAQPIGWFNTKFPNNVFQISMVDNNGVPKATVSPLTTPSQNSFTDTWMSPGH